MFKLPADFLTFKAGRRPSAAWGVFNTPHGRVLVRPQCAHKQRCWVLVLDGPPLAVNLLEPRTSMVSKYSHRRQVTPAERVPTPNGLREFYKEKKAEWDVRLGATPPAPPTPKIETLGDLITLFNARHAGCWRRSTADTISRWWLTIKNIVPEKTILIDISRSTVEQLVSGLVEKELSPYSVRNIVGLFSRSLSMAVDDEIIKVNPTKRVKLPSIIKTHRRTLTADEGSNLLDVAEATSVDLYLVVAMAVLCGLRRSEALAATWADVDFTARLLRVSSDADFTTKSGRDRFIPISERMLSALQSVVPVPIQPTEYIVCPDQIKKSKGWRWDFRVSWSTLLRVAGLPEMPFHGLRRTFATRAVESGVPLTKVKQWLGHSSVVTTEVYVQHVPAYDQDVELVMKRPSKDPGPAFMAG